MHKSKTGCVVAFILVVVLLVGSVGVFSSGFKDWNWKDWFNKDETELDPNGGVVDGDGNDMSGETVHNLPKNMVFKSSTLAAGLEDGITVKAVITPTDVENSAVDWNVVFVNPTSTWATGKVATTYVTATPTADGSLTATIKCLAAYGEKIKIVVTSRDNVDARAECVADYSKRLSSVSFKIGSHSVTSTSTGIYSYTGFFKPTDTALSGFNQVTNPNESFGTGTLSSSYKHTLTLRLSADFIALATAEGLVVSQIAQDSTPALVLSPVLFNSIFGANANRDIVIYNKVSALIKKMNAVPLATRKSVFELSYVSKSTYDVQTFTLNITINDFAQRVQSVSLDDTNLVF